MTSLPLWSYCSLTYLAVLIQDQFTRDRLVYARLLVREALCHGGWGWLDYDRLLQQQSALDPSLPWGKLHPSLVASAMLSQRAGGGTFCRVCQGCHHLAPECAMAAFQTSPQLSRPPRPAIICLTWNEGRCAFPPGQCLRKHACATCGSSLHWASDCKYTPPDSRFRTSIRGQPPLPPPPPGPPSSH